MDGVGNQETFDRWHGPAVDLLSSTSALNINHSTLRPPHHTHKHLIPAGFAILSVSLARSMAEMDAFSSLSNVPPPMTLYGVVIDVPS